MENRFHNEPIQFTETINKQVPYHVRSLLWGMTSEVSVEAMRQSLVLRHSRIEGRDIWNLLFDMSTCGTQKPSVTFVTYCEE